MAHIRNVPVRHRNPVTNLGFRRLLQEIAQKYPDGDEFTSAKLADELDLPRKYVSNLLRRLFAMGLLQRRRHAREYFLWRELPQTNVIGFITRGRGFEYSYRLGERGAKYVAWLKRTKHMRDAVSDELLLEMTRGSNLRLELLLKDEPRPQRQTRQPGFVQNPSAAVLAMWEWIQRRQRQNEKVQLDLFMHALSEKKRAEQAENAVTDYAIFVLVVACCIRRFDLDLYERLMESMAKSRPAFAKALLRMNAEGKQPSPS